MTLRRALAASPLAVSVAVLAHVVLFGAAHAPGAERSSELLEALGAALCFGLLGAFGAGLFAAPGRLPATEAPSRYAPLLLAAAGAVAFGLIELSEGQLAPGPLFGAALTAVPLAYLVAFVAGSAERCAREAGRRCGAFAYPSAGKDTCPVVLLGRERPTARLSTLLAAGTSRGRAPPLF